jgi:hypothetical protein
VQARFALSSGEVADRRELAGRVYRSTVPSSSIRTLTWPLSLVCATPSTVPPVVLPPLAVEDPLTDLVFVTLNFGTPFDPFRARPGGTPHQASGRGPSILLSRLSGNKAGIYRPPLVIDISFYIE